MRRIKHHRQHDIFNLTLKYLPVGDEIFCTQRTYNNVARRLQLVCTIYADRVYMTFGGDGVQTIKRMA